MQVRLARKELGTQATRDAQVEGSADEGRPVWQAVRWPMAGEGEGGGDGLASACDVGCGGAWHVGWQRDALLLLLYIGFWRRPPYLPPFSLLTPCFRAVSLSLASSRTPFSVPALPVDFPHCNPLQPLSHSRKEETWLWTDLL
eukprot:927480-Rhodomonas_salina.2